MPHIDPPYLSTSQLGGLIRKQEVESVLASGGEIKHALRSGILSTPGSLYCPIIKPDTSGLQKEFEEEFLKAMNEPIADKSKMSHLGCAFVVRLPEGIDLEELRNQVSREVRYEQDNNEDSNGS